MRGDASEGARSIARYAVRTEDDEIDPLLLRELDKHLVLVHMADDERSHRRALSG